MSEDKDKALIDLKALTKPATVLVEKVSSAFGTVYEPRHTVRMAEAQAQADKIKVQSDIEIEELRHRASLAAIERDALTQRNAEAVLTKALPHLEETASPEAVDTDWLANFFDKSKIVSDDEMQNLWAKVLAGEANHPGAYSRRTVNLLNDLEKSDAELFRSLCRFSWQIDGLRPLIFDLEAQLYTEQSISHMSLSHLDSLGLIQFSSVGELNLTIEQHGKFNVFYGDRPITLELPTGNQLPIGKVQFSQAGQQLARISDAEVIDGFFEYVAEKWKNYTQ